MPDRALALVFSVSAVAVWSGCVTPLVAFAMPVDGADVDCDGVVDVADAFRGACGGDVERVRVGAWRVALVLVVRDPALASLAALDRLNALGPVLGEAFVRASGGRAAIDVVSSARVLVAPPGLGSLDADAPALARSFFAAPGAPLDVEILVLVAVDVPVAGMGCACVAWHQRARNPGLLGPAMDVTRAFGAPSGFVGVTGLARLDEVADGLEMEYRFLHETGHAWCCRVPRDRAPEGLLAARGAHWSMGDAGGTRDPLAGDGSEAPRGRVAWAYSDLTLVAMGALDPREAAGVRVARGWVSAWDVLALSR